MKLMTESEQHFKKILANKGLICHKIPEAVFKTPDFIVEMADLRLLVEVKEISHNPEQKEILKNIEKNSEYVSNEGDIGFKAIEIYSKSIKNILKSAIKQFKKYRKNDDICFITIADNRDFFLKDLNLVSTIKNVMIGKGHYQSDKNGKLIECYRELGLFSKYPYISAIIVMSMQTENLLFLHNENTTNSAFIEPFISIFKDHEYSVSTPLGKQWRKFIR